MTNMDGDGRGFLSDANRNEILPLALLGGASEENAASEMIVEPKVFKPVEETTEYPAKKKRKVRHTKDEGRKSGSEGVGAMFHPNGNDGKPSMSNLTVKVSGARNDQFDVESRLVSEGTSLPSLTEKTNLGSILDSQNINSSATREEDNRFERMVDCGLGEDARHLEVVSVMVPSSSAREMDANGGGGNVSSAGSMRKKKKVQKTAAKIQETLDMELIGEGERINPSTDKMAEGNGLSLEDDHEVIKLSNNKAPGHVGPDLALKEASLLLDAEKSIFTIANSHKLLGSDAKKEDNAVECEMESKLDQDVPTMHAEGVCTKIPDFSAALMDAGAGSRDVNTDVKRKKRKVKRTAKVKDTREMELIGNDEIKNPHETIRSLENGVSLCSDEWKKDNAVESKIDSKFDEEVPAMHAQSVSTSIPDISAALTDAGAGSRDVNTDAKKKKRIVKITAEVKDIRDVEQIGNDEMKIPDETIRPEENGVLGSDDWKKDNAVECKMDSELDQDVPTMHAEGVCTNIPEFSAALMDGGSGSGDVNTDMKRKKKKVKRTAKVKGTRDMEHIGKIEMKNLPEIIRSEENCVSLEHDNKVTLPSASKAPDHVYPDLAMKEASIIRDADNVMEPEISSCIKGNKKKREKKLVGINMENSCIADIHGIRGSLDLPSLSGYHILKGTGNEESIGLNGGKGVEMILMDVSNNDAQEKIWDVNRREADLVETQTEQVLEDVNIRNNMTREKPRSSAGDRHTDFPSAETENTIMESNHADKDNENTGYRHTKSKKKKKRRHTANDVQENLPVGDPQVGSELEATKQTSIFANSELEGRCVNSSQVLSRKSEEKVDTKHELVLNTDGHAENTGKSGEGINFKQYFVADQLQNEVDSSDKVRNATMSQRSSTKVESNDFPSLTIPTELRNSINSFENKKPESNSVREDTVRAMYGSVHNSDRDETSPNSLKKSLKTTEKEVNDSSPELCEMPSQNPNDIVTAPSFQNKIPSLDKSSSERSETLHNNVGNEKPLLGSNATFITAMKTPKKKIPVAKSGAILNSNRGKEGPVLGQNATSLMLAKTPKKKISLAKSGAIFQDNSGESSGDENGTMQSNDSTLSPSDSSSMSGDSAGDSELSQNSVSNGMSYITLKLNIICLMIGKLYFMCIL